MEQVKMSPNRFEFFETEQTKEKKLLEQDKDFIIADVMIQNAELQQQVNDMSFVLADLMMGGNKS